MKPLTASLKSTHLEEINHLKSSAGNADLPTAVAESGNYYLAKARKSACQSNSLPNISLSSENQT